MPFDSNGKYALPDGYQATTGQDILPSQHNPPLEDIGGALTMTLVKDGRAPMVGTLNMGGNAITNLDPGVNPTDAATVGQAASAIGDFKDSARELDETWLKRDGELYLKTEYPDLAAVMEAKVGPLPDGINWSSIANSITGNLMDVRQVPGGFMAMSDGGTDTLVYKSTDGEAWTQIGTIASFRVTEFAYGNSIYVAGDGFGYTAVSNDGITWTKSGGVTITTGTGGIDFGAGVFVLVGVGGVIKTSPDGVSWTTRTSGVSTLLNSVRFVNSVFVVVGASGVILTSPDGTTWTARTSGVAVALNGVAYGAGVYVVVGANGTILSSSNLTTWTARTSGTTLELNDIVYSTSGFVTVGNSGVARISGNGTSWTTAPTGVGTSFNAITFDPNAQQKYFAVGSTTVLKGIRTLPTQFAVPDDDPVYGWIKALAA